MELHLHIPADCPVAKYKMYFETWSNNGGRLVRGSSWPNHGTEILVLFNPWCPNDQVTDFGRDYSEDEIMMDTIPALFMAKLGMNKL